MSKGSSDKTMGVQTKKTLSPRGAWDCFMEVTLDWDLSRVLTKGCTEEHPKWSEGATEIQKRESPFLGPACCSAQGAPCALKLCRAESLPFFICRPVGPCPGPTRVHETNSEWGQMNEREFQEQGAGGGN